MHAMAALMVNPKKPEKLSKSFSDLSFQLSKQKLETEIEINHLPAISESVESMKCECCGMSEDCTTEYIKREREKLCGKCICGLCVEAVKEEVMKNGGKKREALDAHMFTCVQFCQFGRANPVRFQAEAMREMLKKKSGVKKGGISRSYSCIPAIMKETNKHTILN